MAFHPDGDVDAYPRGDEPSRQLAQAPVFIRNLYHCHQECPGSHCGVHCARLAWEGPCVLLSDNRCSLGVPCAPQQQLRHPFYPPPAWKVPGDDHHFGRFSLSWLEEDPAFHLPASLQCEDHVFPLGK